MRGVETLLVDEVQDVDRSQLELALLLTGETRDIFLVGDDDQTIYAWRLADVRRVLDLAAALPGLRRVDLVTNYRCPKAVVERAVRLVETNRERFVKEIRAVPAAGGELILAPDPGDDAARARRLLTTWFAPARGRHAVLARTDAELAPFAAVAIEMGIAYQAAEDGLLLDDGTFDDLIEQLAKAPRDAPLPVALARSGDQRNRRRIRSALLPGRWARATPQILLQLWPRPARAVPACALMTLTWCWRRPMAPRGWNSITWPSSGWTKASFPAGGRWKSTRARSVPLKRSDALPTSRGRAPRGH